MNVKHLYIVEEQKENSGQKQKFLVKNNNTGKFVRLGGREIRFLLTLLGEEENVDTLNIENTEQLNEEEKTFIQKKFEEWCFLSDTKPKTSRFQDLSKIKIVDFKVDKVMKSIYPAYVKMFSKSGFVSFIALFVINALIILGTLWKLGTMEQVETTVKFTIPDIIVYVILLLLSTAFHEMAHGVVCKKYGGNVSKMGIVLFYLFPAFYCDVTNIYLIPDRKKRAKVSLAGVYINIYIGLFLLLAAQIISLFGIVSISLIAFSITSIFVAFYNLIPFVKLDGYWFVSSITGMANLLDKSFIAAYITFSKRRSIRELQISRRKRVLLTLFFICSVLFKPVFWGYNIANLVNIIHIDIFFKIMIIGVLVLVVIMDLAGMFTHCQKLKKREYQNNL